MIGQLVVTNLGLNVPIGRSVYLDPSRLYIEPPLPGEVCKVEVAVQEPFYQRVGRLEPQVGVMIIQSINQSIYQVTSYHYNLHRKHKNWYSIKLQNIM